MYADKKGIVIIATQENVTSVTLNSSGIRDIQRVLGICIVCYYLFYVVGLRQLPSQSCQGISNELKLTKCGRLSSIAKTANVDFATFLNQKQVKF